MTLHPGTPSSVERPAGPAPLDWMSDRFAQSLLGPQWAALQTLSHQVANMREQDFAGNTAAGPLETVATWLAQRHAWRTATANGMGQQTSIAVKLIAELAGQTAAAWYQLSPRAAQPGQPGLPAERIKPAAPLAVRLRKRAARAALAYSTWHLAGQAGPYTVRQRDRLLRRWVEVRRLPDGLLGATAITGDPQ
jgi:hypothetical protein